jgi:2-iminobutanoate/2-iminopropanoate deaminase
MKIISTEDAPAPLGHYSQAISTMGLVFVAGQLGIVPGSQPPYIPIGIEAQTRQVLRNVSTILESAGSGLMSVLSATFYLSDMAHWQTVNDVVAEIFGTHRPARTIVPSLALSLGALVEVQVIAGFRGS